LQGEATEFEQPLYAAKLLTRSDLRALPKPEPLIGNVLDQGTTALLYGTWGTAKTFIALDWAASVATGRDWQARESAQRRVLYVLGEGAFGFTVRVDAWETGW
jgi:RecA-family ATPase